MSHGPEHERATWTKLWGAALLLAAFAAGMWFAWLGWDHQYYEVDGVAQGPYRAWQVIGCGAAIAGAAVLAYLWSGRTVPAIVVLAGAATIGFAVPWSVDAAGSDDTGLWAVGLFLLLVGGGLGLAVLLGVTYVLARPDLPASVALAICGVLTLLLLLAYAPLAVVPFAVAIWVFFRRWLPQRRTTRAL